MEINKKLAFIKNNLTDYMVVNQPMPFKNNDELVFDIEACAINNKTEMLTYSIACMSCHDETDRMYWYNDVEYFLDMLLNADCKSLKIYAHNCLYDIKPFLIKFVEKYGNNEVKTKCYTKIECNKFTNFNSEKINYQCLRQPKLGLYEYKLLIKEGIFYSLTIQGPKCLIQFLDSYKIIPDSLKKASEDFLGLMLPKDGLDYNKERTLDDKLTKEELNYICDDVFSLKYLIKLCCIDGFEVNGKYVKFNKLTNSAQSLYDYKETLLEDYNNRSNAFIDKEFYKYVNEKLKKSKFYETDNDDKKCNELFKSIFPQQNKYVYRWERLGYYGGLCTPHYENVAKFLKYKDHKGKVFDVNSLYPFIMTSRLLPYGVSNHDNLPYEEACKDYKEKFPLYIQEIIIHDFQVKKGKMAWVQVKGNKYFGGREILQNNIDKNGNKRDILLRLPTPLYELLFECYDVISYTLGEHMAFRGVNDLFKNYIDFWKTVKQTSEGARRAVAKLRQNGLYGKFGMSCESEITNFKNNDGVFTIEHTGEYYVSDTVYLPMAVFITGYAKQYLVQAINNNYDRFMYCDTDSLHLYGTETPRGMEIDKKKYGAWDNELTFDDFKYLSPKRYAERDVDSKEWTIKCCGLTDEIMKKVDDINTFDICEYEPKVVKKMIEKGQIYKLDDENDVYYYKDRYCSVKIVGLYKSKKSKIVKNGTLILEQPYMITKLNNEF